MIDRDSNFEGASPAANSEESPFDVKGLLRALLRYLWLVALLGLLGGLAAMSLTRNVPVAFRSTAVIQVESEAKTPVKVGFDGEQDLKSPENVNTIIENFGNRSLMLRVVRALDLTNDPRFASGGEGSVPEEAAVRYLKQATAAAIRPKTRLVDVSALHTNPLLAREIADALVEEFLKQGGEQRYKALEVQNTVLVQKATELRAKLEQAENESQAYQVAAGSSSLEESRQLITAKLTTLSAQLTAAKGELRQLEADLQQIKAAAGKPDALLAIASIAKDPAVIATKERIALQENAIASLAQSYRDKHPKMIEAQSQLINLKESLAETIRALPAQLENQQSAASNNEATLAQAVAEQEKAALELDQKLTPFRRLQREAESNRIMYEAVAQQLKQSTLALGIEPIAFRVVEPAAPATRPASKRMLVVIGAAFMGSILGLGFVAALFFMDSSIHTVDDAERLLNLPVLAAIPLVQKNKNKEHGIALLSQPGSTAAESFRSLRTSLALSGPEIQPKVILVTSAVPGEGKTLTSSNIAIAFAQQGLKTLLIDADLRRPAVSELFQVDDKAAGLSDTLLGHPIELVDTEVANLSILPAGTRAISPAELLTSTKMRELLGRLSLDFARIVIDTAPINVVSDTLNFARFADAVCLVVRSSQTPIRVVRRAIELLRRANVRPLGLALNCLPIKNSGTYYHYSPSEKYGGEETYGQSYNARGEKAAPLGGAHQDPMLARSAHRPTQP